jgi:hypothetical protein
MTARRIDPETPVWKLTVGELLEVLELSAKAMPEARTAEPADRTEKYVYGIAGIAKLLGCSRSTALAYRREGWIEPAIRQQGRKIVCDAGLCLELFGKRERRGR